MSAAGQAPAAAPAGRGQVVAGFVVAGMPQPLLAPERSPAWGRLRAGYERVRAAIEALDADLLLLYSTQWPSVIGHQIQADPEPEWVHVDPEFHDLGDMPYRFHMDVGYAAALEQAARARGLHARRVAYRGFPIDTGSIVALTLLNPGNRLPAGIVSCNMYADRAETIVFGKAARDAVVATGRRCVAVAVTALSNRLFTRAIEPADDRISSLKDDEWNRKLLELLAEGRLEDTSQLMREFAAQANADSKGKALWWLSAVCGAHNGYQGTVHAYEPVWGTGAALVGLLPAEGGGVDKEFDEEDVETFAGERGVLQAGAPEAGPASAAPGPAASGASPRPAPATAPGAGVATSAPRDGATVVTDAAPKPVGAYPHARRMGELLFLSGVGPRQPGTDEIPGGPVRDAAGNPRDYDVAAQTRATIENVRRILEASGSSLDRVVDVTAFLIDMDRDFATYNRVYAEHFASVGATRTTLAIKALPTPIAVELKVIARA